MIDQKEFDIKQGKLIKYIGVGTLRSCPQLTLHAPAGSYVKANAKENNLPFAGTPFEKKTVV